MLKSILCSLSCCFFLLYLRLYTYLVQYIDVFVIDVVQYIDVFIIRVKIKWILYNVCPTYL